MRNWTFWIGVVLALLGIALPALGVPGWLAWALLAVSGAIMVGLGLTVLLSRYWTVQVQRRTHDPALPPRDDRRDLADDLDAFANRMADWLDARAVEAPSIIDANTTAILGQSRLSQVMRVALDDPERWKAHQEATAHYDKTTRAEYLIGWRGEALRLFDAAVELGVVTPKARDRFEKPDMTQLRALPELLHKLAERLRVQAAHRLLESRYGRRAA